MPDRRRPARALAGAAAPAPDGERRARRGAGRASTTTSTPPARSPPSTRAVAGGVEASPRPPRCSASSSPTDRDLAIGGPSARRPPRCRRRRTPSCVDRHESRADLDVEARSQAHPTDDEDAIDGEARRQGSSTRSPRPSSRPCFNVRLGHRGRGPRARPDRRRRRSSPRTTSRSSTRSSCPLVLPRRITYVGKAEYMDGWKTKYIFPAIGMIPIDRSGGDAADRGARHRRRRPRAGRAVRHLPRGHPVPRRQAAQGPHRRRPPGAAHRAARSSRSASAAPIEVMPPDARFPKLFRTVRVRIGRPDRRRPATATGPTTAWCCARSSTRSCTRSASLSGQEYVDNYATKKAEVAAGRDAGTSPPRASRPTSTSVNEPRAPATPRTGRRRRGARSADVLRARA